MPLPNFFCIGEQKAGTSYMYNLLAQHPDICLSIDKEPQFFTENPKGTYEEYLKNFSRCDTRKIISDFSTGHLHTSGSAGKIKAKYGSDIKILVIVRNPVDRAVSSYNMQRQRVREPLGFIEALENEKLREAKEYGKKTFMQTTWTYKYFSCGLYFKQLGEYINIFPQENIKVIVFEELIKNTEDTLYSICSFLGIDAFSFDLNVSSHKTRGYNKKYIQKLLYNEYWFKKYFRKIVGSSVTSGIKKRLMSANETDIEKFKLSKELYMDLMAKYKDDISGLSAYVGVDLFDLWFSDIEKF